MRISELIPSVIRVVRIMSCALLALTFSQNVISQIAPGIYYMESPTQAVHIRPRSFTGFLSFNSYHSMKYRTAGRTLNNPCADLIITDRRPVFMIVLDSAHPEGQPDFKTKWVFSSAAGPYDFSLCRLNVVKKSRVLTTLESLAGFYVRSGPECFETENIEAIEPVENSGVYYIKPQKELSKGQYAFVYTEGFSRGSRTPYIVFDFAIDDYNINSFNKIELGMSYLAVVDIMHYQPKKKKKGANRIEWDFPGAGKVYFRRGKVVEIVPEKSYVNLGQ